MRLFSNIQHFCKKTKAFEDQIEEKIKLGNKPKVLTEGETDPIYIKTAVELLGHQDILEQVDIEWVGMTIGKGKNLNTGKNALNNTKAVLFANPDYLNRKTLLLYDCDTQKPSEDHDYLMIRCIQRREPAKVKHGIENLIPDQLLKDSFYEKKEGKDGGYTMALNKTKFCKWICEERQNPDDFIHFQEIINILIEFLK